MVVARIIIGIIMMMGGCVGIAVCIKEDGLGCLGAVASGISCFVIALTIALFPPSELQTFWGMDYVTLEIAAGCLIFFCLLFSETHIGGIVGCFVFFFTGLLMTGLLDATTVAMLSDYVGNAALIVFSPILIPIAIIIIFLAIM